MPFGFDAFTSKNSSNLFSKLKKRKNCSEVEGRGVYESQEENLSILNANKWKTIEIWSIFCRG